MALSSSDVAQLYRNQGKEPPVDFHTRISARTAAKRPEPVAGPLSVLLTLHGHCPSKKNGWRMAGERMIIPTEMKNQIEALTLQAMFQWKLGAPVEHPDVTVQFFVSAARQDEDGMWTTVLDCLQKAGVLVNDNIAHFNGRKIHEPCQFVSQNDERVEILVEKK